jgi:hypothetical protein
MPYYVWVTMNLVFLMISTIYIWLFGSNDSSIILTGTILSQIAIVLFLINVNMYFILLVIRKSKKRNIKITLSRYSRKMMKAHIPIALIGTSFIILHGGIMIVEIGELVGYGHPKLVTGYIGILLLALTIFGGYRRHKKASGYRRKFHLISALGFTIIFIIHLFLPL